MLSTKSNNTFADATSSTFNVNTEQIRSYYNSGATKNYTFRIQQLRKLKNAILENEKDILEALHTDLKKNAAEAYFTEIGLTLAEINKMLKCLRRWMRPRKVKTNLFNFPSKSYLLHDPLGVVFIIAPWNYPFQLCLLPLAGAIAAGNCAVIKPSELSSATATIIEKIIRYAFPENYVTIVQGDGATVVPQLMKSFRFDHVFYTGSIEVGKNIYQMAAQNLIPVTLELGGKSPCIVEADANLKIAAKRIALGKFTNAGQTCIAPDYLLVHESVREKFLQIFTETIQHMYSADASTNEDYGKIINWKRFGRLMSFLKQGEVIYGGRYNADTLYISPTVITNVDVNASIMNEEIFGPVLPVFSFTTIDEARQIILKNPDPLAFYLFTNSKDKEKQWMDIAFGGGCINNTALHFTNGHLPFGGVRNSGAGRYHGKYSFETFSHAKSILKTPTWFDPSIKYPPYEGKLKWLKKLFGY